MGIQCLICHCRYRKGCGISFHSFPKEEKYKLLWLQACRKSSQVHQLSRICSTHFTIDSFESHGDYAKKSLKKSAIPTLCLLKRNKRQPDNLTITENINEQPETVTVSLSDKVVSEHCDDVSDKLDGKSSVRTTDKNEIIEENMECSATGSGPSTPVSHKERKIWRPSKVGECNDFSTPRRAKHCFQIAVRKIDEQRKKLRATREMNRRLRKKVSILQDALKKLRQKKFYLRRNRTTINSEF